MTTEHLNYTKTAQINTELILQHADTEDLTQIYQLKLNDLGIETIENLELAPQIRSIILTHNRIVRIQGLSKLQDLRDLNIDHNRIEEVHDTAFNNSKMLTSLSLAFNAITKVYSLPSLQRLTNLNLQGNRLTGVEFLSNLKELRVLNLDFNLITKIDAINYLSRIEELYLSDNKIAEINDREFASHNHLFQLDISGNELKSISFIKNLAGLTILDASNNKIDSILDIKKTIDTLERLDVSQNKIPSVDYIDKQFPSLVCLNLSQNEIMIAAEFRFMRGMPELSELSFKDNPVSTADFEQKVKDMYPFLESLNDVMLHKPGYKERVQMKDLKSKLGEPSSNGDIDDEESALNQSTLNQSMMSTQNDMRQSQSFFRTTGEGFGGKAKMIPVVQKTTKVPNKKMSKLEEMMDTEEKFKEFVNGMNLEMYEIKCRADQIRNFGKMKTDTASQLENGAPDLDWDSTDSETESPKRIKEVNDDSTRITEVTESVKDSQSEIDLDELKRLEEKYRGQFIGSREDAKVVKRNILIRKPSSGSGARPDVRKPASALQKTPGSEPRHRSPGSAREPLDKVDSGLPKHREQTFSVGRKKPAMSATGGFGNPATNDLSYKAMKQKQDETYDEIKKTLKTTNPRDGSNRSSSKKRIEEATKSAQSFNNVK